MVDELNRLGGKVVAAALLSVLRLLERGALTALEHDGELVANVLHAQAPT